MLFEISVKDFEVCEFKENFKKSIKKKPDKVRRRVVNNRMEIISLCEEYRAIVKI